MMHGWHRDRRCLHLAMRPQKLLKAAKRAAVEFLGNRIGTGEVRIYYADQSNRFAVLGKLVIDARVIAPKSADTDYGN